MTLCPHCGQPRPDDGGAAVLPPSELEALERLEGAVRAYGAGLPRAGVRLDAALNASEAALAALREGVPLATGAKR